jgi:AcrR family transcriptional regulator
MTTSQVGRRERKKSETHQAIRVAALRLCAERELSEVTVEEIADAADVAVRTFYAHYPSKEDAIVGFDASRVEQLRLALLERPIDEAPLESLRVVLERFHVESRDEWSLRMRVLKKHPVLVPRMFASFAVFERAMIEAVAVRTKTNAFSDLYPALVTAVATAAFRASIGVWRANSDQRSFNEIFEDAFRQIGGGLVAPLGSDAKSSVPRSGRTNSKES